jgi:hypothetical protein
LRKNCALSSHFAQWRTCKSDFSGVCFYSYKYCAQKANSALPIGIVISKTGWPRPGELLSGWQTGERREEGLGAVQAKLRTVRNYFLKNTK